MKNDLIEIIVSNIEGIILFEKRISRDSDNIEFFNEFVKFIDEENIKDEELELNIKRYKKSED